MERTLCLVKPDGVQRGLMGEVISRFERKGLQIVGVKMQRISAELAAKHYAAHLEKPFYPTLVEHITSGPVLALAVEGHRAVEVVRSLIGKTDPAAAMTGTIRGDFGLTMSRNIVHAADSVEAAAYEIALYFTPAELLTYDQALHNWIFRED
ncbi:MAG: nucleoside-diphosphate kinase [Firmicutes bacterium]|nr:nucleoside-diphosphate kinase [Dethiobacter sp.]MBS3889373.1 nucleoside-diphosphate kinase [Bacillota bacterium]MBS4055297.1 nucleoside-diphosphate kinase [Thermaerobacter sp.]